MKRPVIELLEYNFLVSLLDYLGKSFNNIEVNGKSMQVVQAYSDPHIAYISPSLSVEILNRKNRKLAFSGYLGEVQEDDAVTEIEGMLMEYRVQLNVYSNTRGENHKWNSILDNILKIGEVGIPLNAYHSNGEIKQESVGRIEYDFDDDIKNNNLSPSVMTYDFHTIYEIKIDVIQSYIEDYDYAEIGEIVGQLNKRGEINNG